MGARFRLRSSFAANFALSRSCSAARRVFSVGVMAKLSVECIADFDDRRSQQFAYYPKRKQ